MFVLDISPSNDERPLRNIRPKGKRPSRHTDVESIARRTATTMRRSPRSYPAAVELVGLLPITPRNKAARGHKGQSKDRSGVG